MMLTRCWKLYLLSWFFFRYEHYKKSLQVQLSKNEQSIRDVPSDSATLKDLHTRLQEIQVPLAACRMSPIKIGQWLETPFFPPLLVPEAGHRVFVAWVYKPVLPTEWKGWYRAGEIRSSEPVAGPAVVPSEERQLTGCRPQADWLHWEPHGGLHWPPGSLPETTQRHHGLYTGRHQHPEGH